MKLCYPEQERSFFSCREGRSNNKGETRSLTKEWFYRTLDNREKILSSWLVYSPRWSCIYCFCCTFFNSQEVKVTIIHSSFNSGFQKWWKLNPKISQHENSLEHLKAFEKWKELEMRLGKGWTLDLKLLEQISATPNEHSLGPPPNNIILFPRNSK